MPVIVDNNDFTIMPKAIFRDPNISLQAKGLYAELYITKSVSNPEHIAVLIKELINSGYVTQTMNEYHLNATPIKTKHEEAANSMFSPFAEAINNYTNDENLRHALTDYFNARLYPTEGSRFENFNKPTLRTVGYMLKSLDECKGDKVKIVRHCTENQYGKFFELKTSRFDGVCSGTYNPNKE